MVLCKTMPSRLVKSLENLIAKGLWEATTPKEAPKIPDGTTLDDNSEIFSDGHLGLTITTTPQGRFVY